MKTRLLYTFLFAIAAIAARGEGRSWIRINQLGYLPRSVKVAVVLSSTEGGGSDFELKRAATGEVVFRGTGRETNARRWGMARALRLDFSPLATHGEYYVEWGGERSPTFRIAPDVWDGSADFLLRYMRQQRCGYNPYLDTLCHQHDAFIVDHPTRTGERIDVRGGWHDASDYLQYLPTSANATYQMLFAWSRTPDKTIFRDHHDAMGREGANGVPDILDEARWGLEWMVRMNPAKGEMFNQIADDRDHAGMRWPSRDWIDYGWGKGLGRPVYFITGAPQGLGKHKNRSTGVASSAAKFASAFALGAEVFGALDPSWATQLEKKALEAYDFAASVPGNFQTACMVSPYFYEEDNWVDDMELAAATMHRTGGEGVWLQRARGWGELEEVTPWMELGRARHYQFYPFVNLGHYLLAQSDDGAVSDNYTEYMRKGLECLRERAAKFDDPFLYGIPFIWCSNNLVAAAITQARLYHETSGDDTYIEMEASLRDWLFGCNPWGTSMICGLPEWGDYPSRPHSFVSEQRNDIPYGGLVDGPIYRSIYENLRGIHLRYDDPYTPFQGGAAVYHDDPGDYSSNEPTMDGTASLSFYLSSMEKLGRTRQNPDVVVDSHGAVVRLDGYRKVIHLVFPADSLFEGAETILKTLDRNRIKGSWFLTGNALRMERHAPVIRKIVSRGHYLGGHSDRHLLYAPWGAGRSKSLVGRDSLARDLARNMAELEKWGIERSDARYYLPPFEWYNRHNTRQLESEGLTVINYTPGVRTAADYTTPEMKNYTSSQAIIDSLLVLEREQGLSGAILLIHPGTHPSRSDKLYLRLDEIIKELKRRGYSFERL